MLENNYINLFLGVPDTDFSKLIEGAIETGSIYAEIYKKIEVDLDKNALRKKQERMLDKQYITKQTELLCNDFDINNNLQYIPDSLETGRSRITAEEILIFICIRAFLDSVTDKDTVDRMRESTSLYIYYSNKNKVMPKPSTINENVNCISNETLEFIQQCQLAQFINEGLDDFNYAIFDSTSVAASSSWPTDAGVIFKLFKRIQLQTQKLKDFDLKNIGLWYTPDWLSKLSHLLFVINNAKGTAKCPKKEKVKPSYSSFLRTAHKMNEYFVCEFEKKEKEVATANLKPSAQKRLNRLWNNIEDDLLAVSAVLYYAEQRVFEGVSLPSVEKILSLSDTTAAFIKKGDRNSVIGYKPQIGMSKNGFVSALIIEPGNGADSKYLIPLVEKHIETTGIIPDFTSTDDGYSSTDGRKGCLKLGVKDVCFSGAKGKKIIGEELWENEKYIEGRKDRSGVEALMFSLKYVVHFGRLRRRGIEAVKAEMIGKVIAYNYLHKIRKYGDSSNLYKKAG
jgi:hypothetical protein